MDNAEIAKMQSDLDLANSFIEGELRAKYIVRLHAKTKIPVEELRKKSTDQLRAMVKILPFIKVEGADSAEKAAANIDAVNPQDLYAINERKLKGAVDADDVNPQDLYALRQKQLGTR